VGVRARARLSSLFRPRPVPLVTLWSLFCVLLASKTLLIVIIAVVIIPIVVVVAVLIAEIPLWRLLIVSPCIVNMPGLEWTLISSLRLSRTFLHKIFSL